MEELSFGLLETRKTDVRGETSLTPFLLMRAGAQSNEGTRKRLKWGAVRRGLKNKGEKRDQKKEEMTLISTNNEIVCAERMVVQDHRRIDLRNPASKASKRGGKRQFPHFGSQGQ